LKTKNVAIMLLIMALLITASTIIVTGEPGETDYYEQFGPRVDDIIFEVAGSLGAEAIDLEQGSIDLMDWAVPSDKISDWEADPNIVMGDYEEAGFYEFDLNLMMWPIGHGVMNESKPTSKYGGAEPTSGMDWSFPASWDEGHYWITNDQRCNDSRLFRKAISYLVDRGDISSAFPGAIVPMETFIFPVIGGWEYENVTTYPYSVASANASLNAGGFMDYDGDGRREYCKHVAAREAWLAGGPVPPDVEDIPDIQLYIRNDDPIRYYAGLALKDEMNNLDIYTEGIEGSYGALTPAAWKYYNYHIYTGGWGWDPLPDMYYYIWHSEFDIYPSSDGYNYNRYHRQEYDQISEEFMTSPNKTAALEKNHACQEMINDDVACIPLYTMTGYVAHRKYYGDHAGEQQYKDLLWEGFVNEQGYGYYGGTHGYTSLSAHPAGYERGGTLRHGLIDPPDILDPIDSESFYEGCILSKIYDPLIASDPFDVTKNVPWMIEWFQEGTWVNPEGDTCSKITVELLPNILFHDYELVEPDDVNFTFWYNREAQSAAVYPSVKEFHHCNWTGNTIDINFNVTSWLAVSWVSSVWIIPKHIWEPYPPTLPGDPTEPGSWSFNPEENDALIGTGPFRCYADGVVGRIDKETGLYYHLERNPTYFRKLVRPDFYPQNNWPKEWDTWDGIGYRVEIDDFMTAVGHFGTSHPTWDAMWGPLADVSKDRIVDSEDLMEIAVRYGQIGYKSGYPPYYNATSM
jgi:hypothetical protein